MTNDDTRIGTDDMRRELRDADRQHHDVDRSWRTTLRSLFDPERGTSECERSAFLGLPDRRGFLRRRHDLHDNNRRDLFVLGQLVRRRDGRGGVRGVRQGRLRQAR